jgi:hypothetical protein
VASDPFTTDGLYFGSQFLHHSEDRGNTWKTISPDLTTNDLEKQNQAESGGLTIDATQAENHCTILCIAPNPQRAGEIWVGTDDGRLQHTIDGGVSWVDHAIDIKRFPMGAWIPQIHISAHDPDEVYVVVNDYRRNNWQPFLYRTNDAGDTWVRMVLEGGEVSGHALSVVQDPVAPSLLFLGTEEGLFVSFDRGTNWKRWTHEIPSVPVRDMVIHPRDGDLILGTFGRAAYVIDDLAPLRALATEGNATLDNTLNLFAVSEAYQVNYRRPLGARFTADHDWEGENRRSGVRIQYYVHPDSAEAYGKDELLWAVLNASGDTVRNGGMDAEAGLQDMWWRFDSNGMPWPGREIQKKEKFPSGGGPQVLPGEYTISMNMGNHTTTTLFEVKPDPRVPFDAAAHQQRDMHRRLVMKEVEPIVDAMDQIQRALATIKVVKEELKWLPDSMKKETMELTDSLKTALLNAEELYTEPRDAKGTGSVTERLSSVMWDAFSINGGDMAPGGNAIRALERLQEGGAEFCTEVATVMSDLWSTWLQSVETVDRSPQKLFEAAGEQE